MSLILQEIRKSYREPGGTVLPILNIRRFELASGEQMALLGPSGGGKTTLLNVIAGITTPDSGSVVIDGVDIAKLHEVGRDRFRSKKIGFVFQTFNLLAAFTALENVLVGMSFAGLGGNKKRAEELLKHVGLGHRLHHRPAQMSVGEQQRVAVARALANQPSLVLADEPTANVDPANQQTILDLIRANCRERGVSLLVVTHSLEAAGQFDRVDKLSEFNHPRAA
ncbi:MAG: ABC transporter ATP-binding protein [Planctomycetota bacterium]|nr:ABC transporter ATP-binding protein [Planctomycetota bacterium]